ncbi:MAG: BrnT family toxin [Hydrogenophaga sp.]|nr:BrnT family toxin [Hydrogenophaga sp.]
MDISFDSDKNVSNIGKHGVPLTLASRIDWSEVLSCPDDRKDYGELREIGFAVIDDRLYVVVFVQRDEMMRVISLRKANAREVQMYDQANQ